MYFLKFEDIERILRHWEIRTCQSAWWWQFCSGTPSQTQKHRSRICHQNYRQIENESKRDFFSFKYFASQTRQSFLQKKNYSKGKEHMIDNEIFIMKSCNHPNIVKLHEEFETKNEVYLVTDLVKVNLFAFPSYHGLFKPFDWLISNWRVEICLTP